VDIISNEVDPNERYKNEKESINKQDEKAPITKYLKPDSLQYSELFQKPANT